MHPWLCVTQHHYLCVYMYAVLAGAPIFTYTHEPDDSEIHNRCKTMLYYVRGALCKHVIPCQYTGAVVIFVVYSFLTSSFV